MTLAALLERQRALGLVDDVDAVLEANAALEADPMEAELPWFLRAIVGVGAWITAVFLLFWVVFALFVFARIDEGLVLAGLSGMLGLVALAVSMATAWWPTLVGRGLARLLDDERDALPTRGRVWMFARTVGLDFIGQMAVVGVLAGQAGFSLGLLSDVDEEVVLALLVLQSLVLWTNPHFALRFLSAAGVGLWAMGLEHELFDTEQLAMGAATVVLVAVWLARPWWVRTFAWSAHAPIGHGLAAFVLLGHVVTNDTLGQPVVNALSAVVVVSLLLREAGVGVVGMGVGVVGAVGAGVLTADVPGVLLSLVVLGLGARARDKVLQGGAVLGLIGYGVYDTIIWDVDHEVRFGVLLGLGLGFLAGAWLLGRRVGVGSPEDG